MKDLIKKKLKEVTNNRMFIATPENRKDLEDFAKSNGGNLDLVLTQMAIQYGYKLALEELLQDENGNN